MTLKCRRCENCLYLRARLWTERATRELCQWPRSWFGTMTLRPADHLRAEQYARIEVGRSGDDFDTLSQDEQFAARHRVISRWLTLWVKRVRKQGEGSLRLMVICEPHTGGGTNHLLPHYHALIHETVAFATSERELRNQWFYGFSKFKVVDLDDVPGSPNDPARAAWYVAKYLTKATSARVRASVAYGQLNELTVQRSKQSSKKNVPNQDHTPSSAQLTGGIAGVEGRS